MAFTFNWVDVGIVLVLLLFLILGAARGLVKAIASLIGTAAAGFLSFRFASTAAAWVWGNEAFAGILNNLYTFFQSGVADVNKLPSVLRDYVTAHPVTEPFAGCTQFTGAPTDNVTNSLLMGLVTVICCIAMVILILIVIRIVAAILHAVMDNAPGLRVVNRVLGAVVGLIEGAALIYVASMLLPFVKTFFAPGVVDSYLAGSQLARVFIDGTAKEVVDWLLGVVLSTI